MTSQATATPAPPFGDPAVAAIFATYPPKLGASLLELRQLIFDTAAATPPVGALIETTKWGQPSYLPAKPRIGTTLRIDRVKGSDTAYALYFPCQSRLGERFRELYPTELSHQGNRAIVLDTCEKPPREALAHCIGLALTYHALAGPR